MAAMERKNPPVVGMEMLFKQGGLEGLRSNIMQYVGLQPDLLQCQRLTRDWSECRPPFTYSYMSDAAQVIQKSCRDECLLKCNVWLQPLFQFLDQKNPFVSVRNLYTMDHIDIPLLPEGGCVIQMHFFSLKGPRSTLTISYTVIADQRPTIRL